MRKPLAILAAAAVILTDLGLSACARKAAAQDEGILPLSPEAYIDAAGIWPVEHRPIEVCWEPSAAAYAIGKKWVEEAVHNVMEKKSAIRFSGSPVSSNRWPECKVRSLGIRIAVSDLRPNSGVGRQTRSMADGSVTEEPTRMQLNFGTGAYSLDCENRRKQCTQYLAIHEFAHAIGFLHEHLREDAPPGCKARYGHQPDVMGFKPVRASQSFDRLSITNYCAHIFANPMPITSLSEFDVAAIEQYYGVQ